MYEIRHYITQDGFDMFTDWRQKVKDKKARIAIDRRIYYAQVGKTIILLLCGGNKSSQDTDIAKACEYWRDWQLSKRE